MTTLKSLTRTPGLLLGVLALIIASLGAAAAVGAATSDKAGGKITVCVKKAGGGLYQATKCQGKDKKLSWNKKGKPGKAGAVAGYSVAQTGTLVINSNHHVQNTVLTLALPAGSYIVNSKAVVAAADDTNDSFSSVLCKLGDGTTTDTSRWNERLGGIVLFYAATTTVANTVAVSSTSPITVTFSCSDEHDSDQPGFTENVSEARITAVQTSSNS